MDHYPQRWAGGFQIFLTQPGPESAPPALLFLNKQGAAAGLGVSSDSTQLPEQCPTDFSPSWGQQTQQRAAQEVTRMLPGLLSDYRSLELP